MQGIKFCTINLAKIKGKGEFKCPKCGIEISPDDKTENAYTILATVMKEDSLNKIILQCNRCGCQIHLTGFYSLNKLR